MMDELRQQAERFGTDVRDGEITAVDFSKRPFTATTDDGTAIKADTVIIATGASAKYLGIDDEQRYAGRGVSACATCDGFFYRKKTVAVVGGGDTACEEASYLSNLADKVYMIVRKDYLRASKVMQRRVMENQKIEIFFNTNTVGLFGDAKVEGAHLVRFKGTDREETFDIAIDGFFLGIGHRPNTDIFANQIALDEQGYIKTDHRHKHPGSVCRRRRSRPPLPTGHHICRNGMQSRPRRRAFPCRTRITHNEEKRNFLCCQIKNYEKNFFFPIKEFTFVATTDKKTIFANH